MTTALDMRQAFLAAILASPVDDSPRLIYADWLEEQGGEPERAEFIRVQCELASPYEEFFPPSRATELRRRQRELLEAHWVKWLADAPLKMDAWSLDEPIVPYAYGARVLFRRGFVAEIVCSWSDWKQHGKAIVRQHPVERVTLAGIRPYRIIDWFYWFRGHGLRPKNGNLDAELYDCLNGGWEGRLGNTPLRHYQHTEEVALIALSEACLRYARQSNTSDHVLI